jgi:hypothetical protein
VGAFVFLVGGQWGTVRALISVGALAVLGSMAVGLALGTATGFVLAIAPRWLLTRPLLRGLLAALTAGLPLAVLSVAFLVGDGYSLASYPPSVHLLIWSVSLVVALVVAARSGDIADGGYRGTGALVPHHRRRGQQHLSAPASSTPCPD